MQDSDWERLFNIKGQNSVLIWRNPPIYNPKPLHPNTNSYTKFKRNWSKTAQDGEWKQSTEGQTDG